MAAYHPSLDVLRHAQNGAPAVPVVRRFLADRITPVGAFARISAGAEHAFLLESVVGGEQIARYSFVAARPSMVIRAAGPTAVVERGDGSIEVLTDASDPLGVLANLVQARFRNSIGPATPETGRPAHRQNRVLTDTSSLYPASLSLPRFTGGAVGYAGYDTVRYYENLSGSSGGPRDDRKLDDLLFGIYDEMVIFDHVNKTLLVVAHLREGGGGVDAAYTDACRRIDHLAELLAAPAPSLSDALDLDAQPQIVFDSTFTQSAFEAAVRKAKDYIAAGDIFQVVLSQRLRVRSDADPFNVYRALRVVNPSPFMFYLKSPACVLVGASPEILCRVEDGLITNRPLAGTRRRGRSAEEDAELERALRADPKDRAEHVMLVDLGRNDVGRVASPGSVQLSEVMSVERYSHVMHLSSNVTGRLAEGMRAVDALRAALPVGTVSGAPKIRAMQIIDELEPVRRGPYGGAVGYLDFSGNMDTCIALRTLVVTPGGSGGAWTYDIQAGAGIVADSDPSAEFEESMNKAKALLAAVGIAGAR